MSTINKSFLDDILDILDKAARRLGIGVPIYTPVPIYSIIALNKAFKCLNNNIRDREKSSDYKKIC